MRCEGWINTIGVIFEDFINYKKTCMTIEMPYCTFKCNKECGKNVCQNAALTNSALISVNIRELIDGYLNNPLSHAIVFQGLEPFYQDDKNDSFAEVLEFIQILREEYKCEDPVIIYTGYTEDECIKFGYIADLEQFSNIIIKFGRFIPDKESHMDEILGVKLASPNQYAKIIGGNYE